MNNDAMQRVIFSLISLLLFTLFFQLFKAYTKKTQKKLNLKMSRYFAIRRFMSLFFGILFTLSLVFIWGIDFTNIWISLTGFVAMIAVAFFAVWSLIGNILAGLIIFFTSPFKLNDTIEVMPDEIKGKVVAVNTFFTLLIDSEGNYINIPNSLLFQRYIKNIKVK